MGGVRVPGAGSPQVNPLGEGEGMRSSKHEEKEEKAPEPINKLPQTIMIQRKGREQVIVSTEPNVTFPGVGEYNFVDNGQSRPPMCPYEREEWTDIVRRKKWFLHADSEYYIYYHDIFKGWVLSGGRKHLYMVKSRSGTVPQSGWELNARPNVVPDHYEELKHREEGIPPFLELENTILLIVELQDRLNVLMI